MSCRRFAWLLLMLSGCAEPVGVGVSVEGVKVCAPGPTTKGIDVSHWDGAIDWAKMKAAGVEFAFMKATEGTTFTDPAFATYWREAPQDGVIRGAYHFFRPAVDPIQQADFFVATAGIPGPGDLPLTLDLEVTDNLPAATVAKAALAFLGRVEELSGRVPIIYTSARVFDTVLATPSGFDHYLLWDAQWNVTCPSISSPTWTRWTVWQYSNTGQLGGLSNLDVNLFNGSVTDLEQFVNPPTPDMAQPVAQPMPSAVDGGDPAAASDASDGGTATMNTAAHGCSYSGGGTSSPVVALVVLFALLFWRRIGCASGMAMMRVLGVVLAMLASSAGAAELRVAVMEFTNAGAGGDAGELGALGKGLQSMVTTDLSQVPAFKLVERERLRDIQSEMKLQRGKAVDQATAAKLGKLAGASHLVSGTFTVLGDKMRLDSRLVAVATGEVVFAEQAQGDKAAFFELEQALVKKIIDAAGVKLQPKERAQLARPQTADFDAFRKYSIGLAAFDDKKYDESLKALREAAELDKDFKLAALTLDDYERLAAKLRARADTVEQGNLEALRREKSVAVKERMDVIGRLWTIAEGKGKAGPADARIQRLIATCRLMNLYHQHLWDGGEQIGGGALARAGLDPFLLDRTADVLAKRYAAEALDVFPQIPAVCASPLIASAPLHSATFDADFAYLVTDQLEKQTRSRTEFLRYHTPSEAESWFFQRLWLDRGERQRSTERLWAVIQAKMKPELSWKLRYEKELAEQARENGALEQSTAHYVHIGKLSSDQGEIRGASDEVDRNKMLMQSLKALGQYLREHLITKRLDSGPDYWKNMNGPPWTDKSRDYLRGARELLLWTDYTLFGAVPAWQLKVGDYATPYSGPRTDRLRTDEIRYDGKAAQSAIFIVEGKPQKSADLKVKVGWKVPDDFQTSTKRETIPKAQAGVAFGMRNVGFTDSESIGIAPLHGWAVLVTPTAAQLVEIKVVSTSSSGLTYTVREEKPLSVNGDKVDLEVSASGGSVEAKVNGQKISFKSPAKDAAEGLSGLVLRGVGYAGFSELKIPGRR